MLSTVSVGYSQISVTLPRKSLKEYEKITAKSGKSNLFEDPMKIFKDFLLHFMQGLPNLLFTGDVDLDFLRSVYG